MRASLRAALIAMSLTFAGSSILVSFDSAPVQAAGQRKANKGKKAHHLKKQRTRMAHRSKRPGSAKITKSEQTSGRMPAVQQKSCGTYMYWSVKESKCLDARSKSAQQTMPCRVFGCR